MRATKIFLLNAGLANEALQLFVDEDVARLAAELLASTERDIDGEVLACFPSCAPSATPAEAPVRPVVAHGPDWIAVLRVDVHGDMLPNPGEAAPVVLIEPPLGTVVVAGMLVPRGKWVEVVRRAEDPNELGRYLDVERIRLTPQLLEVARAKARSLQRQREREKEQGTWPTPTS
jgi:hypothetical protein